jgi:hypothetical protein
MISQGGKMMGNSKKDKELIENLDRILEGRESEVTRPEDEDNRTALEFAGKMASMREKPSKEFTKKLKAQLVHRLSEQDSKCDPDDHELIFWGIPRRKLWQGTLAALITFIIIAIIFVIMLLLNPGS